VVTLADFVRHQTGPLIVAGDFNLTLWTDKLTGFTQATGLERYNSFHFTWPLHVHGIKLLPFVAIDHVFASPHFAKIATRGGPRLVSDHRRHRARTDAKIGLVEEAACSQSLPRSSSALR
jgi:endonuclease/exonuclease/phosphatase (EEP) superfamily protein YafD